MFPKLIALELKSFFRSKAFAGNLIMKILRVFMIIYFSLAFIGLGIGLFFLIDEQSPEDPLHVICRFLLYAVVADILLRYMFQQLSTQNIKPFLSLNINRNTLVKYTMLQTFTSFFTWGYGLLYVPLAITLILNGYPVLNVIALSLAIFSFYLFNNFLNIVINGKHTVAVVIFAVIAVFALLDYYGLFRLSDYSQHIFLAFYNHIWLWLLPLSLMVFTCYLAARYIQSNFYLDKAFDLKSSAGQSGDIQFLNKYGAIGTFINNDIKLIRRSKAAKATIFSSTMFLFYGLLMFSSDTYRSPAMMTFLGIFTTGGFQFFFGQNVPSWDSSYYPLMMTQQVPYKEYLKAKWWLLNIATAASVVLVIFYAYWGWEVYATFFAAGLYNIGVNSQITLLSGAFNKRAIDLNKKAKTTGGKNSFNMKSILLTLPKLVLPMIVFAIVKLFAGTVAAVASLGILGFAGYLLRDKIFDYIASLYKKEKYTTLAAFKETE